MDFIKNTFTIKDLENLSGVKRHTIRIWEKRFNLLSPERTKSNIRYYSTSSLTHLLNIVLLYNNGYKISKIAQLDEQEIIEHCKNLVSAQAVENKAIQAFKLAMLNFDRQLFEQTYRKLNEELTFQEIFKSYFLPFLNEIGLLWQTETINPAHEHFITSLIKQKILVHTEKVEHDQVKDERHKFILFLPSNEIHDLVITYLNFVILNKGFESVYLGQSVPVSCLTSFTASSNHSLIFISYFTVQPEVDKAIKYLEEFKTTILSSTNNELWISGLQAQQIPKNKLPKNIKIFADIPDLLKAVNNI